MLPEPQRSQYLEAMGLTPWVSRYRLPNAAPTQEVAWPEPQREVQQPPAQRLHALLEDVEPAPAVKQAPPATPTKEIRRARALLEPEEQPSDLATSEPDQPPVPKQHAELHQALRFSVQIGALDGRWLVVLPDTAELDGAAYQLLDNLLQAAQIVPGSPAKFQPFRWPMLEGLPVESPLDEAREGLRAFVEGRRRGWRPERLLLFGEDETLRTVLGLEENRCSLLGIAGWQGPTLYELAQSSLAKRALWSSLLEWRQAWHTAADGQSDNDTAKDNDTTKDSGDGSS